MRVVLQRVTEANVTVNHEVVGSIKKGFLLLVGITHEDTKEDAEYLVDKVIHLRIFEDNEGKMNHSLLEVEGAILSVSQFTLYGDTKKGRRPNFMAAAKPAVAESLYDEFNMLLRSKGVDVQTGVFGAMMDVTLRNDGPVTLILESK